LQNEHHPFGSNNGNNKNQAQQQEAKSLDFMKAMSHLFEMGFWNEPLNQQLLHENKMDIGMTVEKLLESGSLDSSGNPTPSSPRRQLYPLLVTPPPLDLPPRPSNPTPERRHWTQDYIAPDFD